MTEWRGEHCSMRGPSLSHIQNLRKFPNGDCVYCGLIVTGAPPEGVPATASEATVNEPRSTYASIYDHKYVYSITGRCARPTCGKPKDDHADFQVLAKADACIVDHRSLEPWVECGLCHEVVEPRMSIAPAREPGTSDSVAWVTPRILNKLDAIHAGWMVGFYKS